MILTLTALAVLYFVFVFWLRNALKKPDFHGSSEDTEVLPSVSVVVAARNEERAIGSLLNHLLQQNYPDHLLDVTVANDGSTDRTGEIVQGFSQSDSRISHVLVNDPPAGWSPKMWALSKGVQGCPGEILLFTDADCAMGPEWVSAMVRLFEDRKVGMVAGPSPLEKNGRLWNRMLLVDSLGQDALAAGGFARRIPLTSSGRNLAIRRSAFNAVNGYDEIRSFFSGDDDLMMHKVAAAGWELRFCLEPMAQVKSPPPSDFRAFMHQRLRFASKGKAYYNLPFVRRSFKWILPMILFTNLGVVVGQATFLVTGASVWLLPWLVKMLGDGILVSRYASLLGRPLPPGIFLLDELWHSLYVVLFGLLGSFLPISWKDRRKNPRVA